MNTEIIELQCELIGIIKAETAVKIARNECEAKLEAKKAEIEKSYVEELKAKQLEDDREAIQEALSGCKDGGCDE